MKGLFVILICLVGCASDADEPKVVETFQITDTEGAPLPETITGVAGSFIDVAIEYKAGAVPTYGNLKVQPPEKWRILWFIHDSSGDDAMLNSFRLPELSPYERLALEGRKVGNSKQVLDWVSPEKPPKETPGWARRWGHIRFPTKPGNYELTISAFPTVPTGKDENGLGGKPFVVYRAPIQLQAPETGQELPQPNVMAGGTFSKRERKLRQQMFGRPSKEFLAKNKE
jgi:hypothetical protein